MSHLTNMLSELREREPKCGSTTIIGIDGRSGAGKTEFAAALGQELQCDVVSLEWVYPGWHGLHAGIDIMHKALSHLARNKPAELPQWDWLTSSAATSVTLTPCDVLILEGVGAGADLVRPFLSYFIWLDASDEIRHERAMQRDGETYNGWWDVWAAQEEQYLASDQPMNYSDLFLPTAPAPD